MLVHQFERVMVYENISLQEKARECIPFKKLNLKAKDRLSQSNKGISVKERPLDIQVIKI